MLFVNPNFQVIAGENAALISQLPHVWQDIAQGVANVGFSEPQSYFEMAQLFQYKMQQGDVDLFEERPQLAHLKSAYSELFGQLAWETLEFYGQDFQKESYPIFSQIIEELNLKADANSSWNPVRNVIRIGMELFNEFGYALPASFYHVHLAPIYQEHLFFEQALRFSERDIEHNRSCAAVLNACKVFALQMKIQSIASTYELTYHHGCGCNSFLSTIDVLKESFEYDLAPQEKQQWICSFVWTMWYEYTFFPIVPKTAYLF